MSTGALPSDQCQRERIEIELGQSMFVEAGAGTGKTASLVRRIVALIVEGKAQIDSIAAITFTRTAASELRERIIESLESKARDGNLGGQKLERVQRALEGIEQAAFQTIDSFALSLLRERPLETGLPPTIRALDEIEAGLRFEDRWNEWLDGALEDETTATAIAPMARLGLGNPVEQLRRLAGQLHDRYELLRGASFDAGPSELYRSPEQVIATARTLRRLLQYNLDEEDRLLPRIESVLTLAGELEQAEAGGDEALEILSRFGRIRTRDGRQENWGATPQGENACAVAKAELATLQTAVDADLFRARRHALAPVLGALARFVLDYAGERRKAGEAEFHDLLVWLRDALVREPALLKQFRRRYTHVLVDEFQDTDPLQTEIVMLLTSGAPAVAPSPGALFVVGDPKQSIFRFRGADIEAVQATRRVMGRAPVLLTHNFRTHDSMTEWVNHVFARWMGADASGRQAAYVPLETPRHPPLSDPPFGVHHIGGPLDELIGAVRRDEARHIARIARSVGEGGWEVRDGKDGADQRPSRWEDLCILVRSRSGMELLEWALQEAGVPYSLEGQSLVYASQEVRDLMAALAAIDDPSDQVALVGALRSPAFGCSDADLAAWAALGAPFDYTAGHDSDGPVARAFGSLARFHEMRNAMSVSELLERLVRERRLRELALASRQSRGRLRLIQLLVEQARALADAGRPSLRQFIDWVAQRRESGARVPEGGVADTDLDSVRIMTVHAAKGLEFPIVLLAGINGQRRHSPGELLTADGPDSARLAVKLGPGERAFVWGDFDTLAERDKAADEAEEVRVMYVAATRAIDHLVVSMYRPRRDSSSLAAKLASHAGEDAPWHELTKLPPTSDRAPPVARREVFGSAEELRAWVADRDLTVEHMARPSAVAATSLGDGAQAGAAGEGPLPGTAAAERRDGRDDRREAALAIGRAVHGVLQDVDLATGDGVDALAERYAAQEGVAGEAAQIAGLAAATLRVPVVRRAVARGGFQREVFVAAAAGSAGEAVLEGIVDLLFEDEAGNIVIVDYKTDRVGADEVLAEAAAPHRLQLGAYASSIAAATGRTVSEAWIVFAQRAAAGLDAEYRLPDLNAAAEDARRTAMEMAAGRSA